MAFRWNFSISLSSVQAFTKVALGVADLQNSLTVNNHGVLSSLTVIMEHHIGQGSQTRGPHAARETILCSPRPCPRT